MNIYEFINSSDIREYLKTKQYTFDPLQQAFLIWQSGRHTLTQKHAAWKELIATLPDMEVPERINCRARKSLHKMLQDYMDLENKYIDLLKKHEPETAFYSWELFEKCNFRGEGEKYKWYDMELTTLSYEKIYEEALKYIKEEISEGTMIKSFRITKNYFDCTDYSYHIVTEYNPAGEILSLFWNTPTENCDDLYKNIPVNVPIDTEEESDLYGQSFDGLWYDFPIPFEEGDIVCDTLRKTPFVLTGTVPWYKQEQAKRDGKPREGCDYSDMIAYGYAYDENDAFLDDDYTCDYLNLEHYTGELKGGEKLLEYYGRYLKEKDQPRANVDAWLLMRLARMYQARHLDEKEADRLKWFLEHFENIKKHKKEEKNADNKH